MRSPLDGVFDLPVGRGVRNKRYKRNKASDQDFCSTPLYEISEIRGCWINSLPVGAVNTDD
jgi:hypothetical protein